MKKKWPTIVLIVILLAGLSLLLYPTVSNYWNSFHSSRAIVSYAESVSKIDTGEYAEIWKAATDYNRDLLTRTNSYILSDEQRAEYDSLLNVDGTGIMGYIEISSLGVSLPIYHGVSDSVLQVAVGHLDWTSLPVGGESTHCVMSGHRGLPSAKLFTDLDDLREGDTFVIRILNEVLTYEVDQILTVDPQDTKALLIEPGRDYCTLVTCTPYGINTHRLLVRGHRTENAVEAVTVRVTPDALQIEPLIVAPLVAAPLVIILLILVSTDDRIKKIKKKRAMKKGDSGE